MAAGAAKRFNGDIKQLYPINGEPIIRRTIRLIRECDPEAVISVVSWRKELNFSDCEFIDTIISPSCLAKSILETAPYWGEYNRILMGDVIFSPEVIREIITDKKTRIYGTFAVSKHRLPERYAFTFPFKDKNRIYQGLKDCVGHPLENEVPCFATKGLKRWIGQYHRHSGVIGFLYWKFFVYFVAYVPNMYWISDPSVRDVDTPEEYQNYTQEFCRGRVWT